MKRTRFVAVVVAATMMFAFVVSRPRDGSTAWAHNPDPNDPLQSASPILKVADVPAAMKYFQSLDNANNKKFVQAFKAKYGAKSVIGDVTQAAYLGPWLWKMSVEKAGSFDIDKVAAASPDIEFKEAPEGYVKLHKNHHLWSKLRIGQWAADGQAKVLYESGLIEPDPFPKGYQ